MKALIPDDVNLENHIQKYPPNKYSIVNFSMDKAMYLLDLIITVPSFDKNIDNFAMENKGYIPLSSALMQSQVSDYRIYMNYFKKTGIIEINERYTPRNIALGIKGKSKCFRYVEGIKGKVFAVEYSPDFSKKLDKRIKKMFIKLGSNYQHLTKWFYPKCSLSIDLNEAYNFLKIKLEAQIRDSSLLDKRKKKDRNYMVRKNPITQFNHSYSSIISISTGKIRFDVDNSVNRFHSSLTSMNKVFRDLLTFNNSKLISIDIVNSQPYLSLVLFNKEIDKVSKHVPLLNEIVPMLKKFGESSDNQGFDDFSILVSKSESQNLDLYNYILEKSLGKKEFRFTDRDEVKIEVLKVFFSKNESKSKIKKLFASLFPSVDSLFKEIKQGNHSRLACILQSIESYAVLQVITKRFAKKYPNVPIFTIHDSIATSEGYVHELEQIMEHELTKLTGFPPKLRIENWLPENLNYEKYLTCE